MPVRKVIEVNHTDQRGVIQRTEHAPHAWMPVPRRSQFCNGLLHSAALCAALSVSGSLFTINERSALPPILGGNDDPSCALRIRVRDVRACKVSERAPSAVFSRCNVVSAVKTPKSFGNEPAGEFPLPTILRDSSHVRFVICSGRDAGTAGKVSCNDETRPAPLHRTPFQVQNLMSLTQPPASSPARPCSPASSHIDLRPQNCDASRATG